MIKRKNLIPLIGMIILLFISGCSQRATDVQLTRHIFNGMCSGRQGVQNLIAWESFKAMGVDVGKAYSNIVAEKERADYRKVFFFNVSYAFRATGGSVSKFTNWRVQKREGDNTIVAADSPSGKPLLFTLSNKGGKRKLIAINWGE
jgi:hypothetical protein